MNKSVCEMFLDGMMPWSTFIGHTQPSPEIWFEMEHFEILSFRGLGSDLAFSHLELEMTLESNSHVFWKFGKFILTPLE